MSFHPTSVSVLKNYLTGSYVFFHLFQQEFSVPSNETFVLTTTDRIIVDGEKLDGTTLYLLRKIDQVLLSSVEEEINFVPHYNTLIESGANEYFIEGQKSLPCALAELVDNALSATAKNSGVRSIEIRLFFNKRFGKPAIIVLDNGSGMTSKQLNNWAIYRLSKFTRENSTFESEVEGSDPPAHVPRSLNSDISFFGVGGKRAVFHMGDAVRMISRPLGSPDVHELVLSKDEFQEKAQKKQDVYRSKILNRMPGDVSHITDDERFLRTIIAEETQKESFTVVVITGIFQEHINYLKLPVCFKEWTRELAHIYHYYIHGHNGNCKADVSPTSDDLRRIDIVVTLWASKRTEKMNLREVEDDMQTLFINAAKDTFEFRAESPDGGIVEGVLRYHPFLYDRETYPKDSCNDDNNEMESEATGQARGRRDIFECFWNGRLIPYTTIPGFHWCQKKGSRLPEECYSRFSGVLFTDGKFRVSATKLKFMELEKELEQRGTHFTRVWDIQKEFTNWLQNCHETLDKQVKFIDYKETVTRSEVQAKKKQHPWAVFSSIEQHGRRYTAGDIVKSQKPAQIIHGTVLKFFLHGAHKGDVFATGGEVEIKREPQGLYEEITKVIPIAKIDMTATDENIKNHIENERKKLPDRLKVDWPEGNVLPENAVLPAGTPIGKILWCPHAGNLHRLGKYTLTLTTVLSDTSKGVQTVYGGRELPEYKHEFRVKEGFAESFSVGELSSSFRVGEPFDIPLHMKDCYNHTTKPPPNIKPALQSSAGLRIGLLLTQHFLLCMHFFQNYDIKVTLPRLKNDTQTVKISLHPGNPHSLLVKSKTNPVEVENGNPVSFEIEVHDEVGNITRFPGLKVYCQIPGLDLMEKDCSAGKADLETKPVNHKIVNGEPQILEARFEIPSQKQVAPVTRQLMVMPSKRISRMELFSQREEELVLKNNENIKWKAGGVLEKLFYKLYDEAGREVPITAEIASNIKVTWGTDVDQRNLVNGWLPDLQVSKHVDGEHLYQVSYQEKKVSFCFRIVPCPDEPAGLKATQPQSIVKLGETLSGDIKLELVDQYNNVTKKLTSTCGKSFSAEAEGLDKTRHNCLQLLFRFHSGSPGPRVIYFHYKEFTKSVVLEVTAGVPSQIKLVSGPEQPLQVLNGHDIPTPFLLQLCDEWGNPSPDENMNVEIKPSPVTLTVKVLNPMDTEGKTCIKVNQIEGSKRYYALEFKGSLNGKSIPGPSVNLTLLPDPNKPVRLSVDFDRNVKFSAGGKFPVFSVTVFSEDGSPMTAFKPADLSMLLWEGPPSMRPATICVNVVANEPITLEPDCQQQTPVVFYCTEMANRILVENMTLKITVTIMEDSPGENGSRYVLHFKPEVTNPPTSLSPFELPFHFYNDFENQQKKVELMKKKDELTEAVKECNKFFHKICDQKDLCLKQKTSELETIEKTPRRIFSIHGKFNGPDILGMVGQLAFVADDDVARVISWILQGDMDCVITTTTTAAQKLYEDTRGNQQVMALDNILVQQEDRPLPHIINHQELFKPSGNPTFARKHLIYPSLFFSLPVFKNILGDTILMDDLVSATNYRKALVDKDIQCPTILTRTGERVSAKGKFGGSQNRAPPIDKLKVFGAPLPDNYEELKKQIGDTVEEIDKAEKDRNDHSTKWLSEIFQKEKEKDAIEGINKQLGTFPICFV
uniref:Structural maintenance of chromosomes flexible hinge domain containing 1 n=1 Tax=Poecilia reticulata TaxID=8081 RepID=A0A3P9NMP1_POERE